MGGGRQHHHNRGQRYRDGNSEMGEFRGPNEPKQKHSRTNGLDSGKKGEKTATNGVAKGGVGDYEHSCKIRESWKSHVAAERRRTVQGGVGNYSAGKCGSEGGG